jgi:hypothetical protein
MGLTANEVRDAVNGSLAEILVPRGFKLRNLGYDRGYGRSHRGVRQTVVLGLVHYTSESKFRFTFHFRVEAAEAVFQQFVEVGPKFRKWRDTCFVTLNTLIPAAGEEFVVRNRRSLQLQLSKLMPALERDVLPFLDAHRDLHSIDRLLNGRTRDWFATAGAPYHSMNAVIVARLAGNPDWAGLVREHRQRLRGRVGDEELATFERLVRYLSHLPDGGAIRFVKRVEQ